MKWNNDAGANQLYMVIISGKDTKIRGPGLGGDLYWDAWTCVNAQGIIAIPISIVTHYSCLWHSMNLSLLGNVIHQFTCILGIHLFRTKSSPSCIKYIIVVQKESWRMHTAVFWIMCIFLVSWSHRNTLYFTERAIKYLRKCNHW